jgi:2'-5' RNA ligase
MLKNLYFLGIIPPREIADEITRMKLFCAENFKTVHALNSPSHITVVPPFRSDLQGEKNMLGRLAVEAKSKKSIFIELKGFDHFSNRVVFVSVEQNPALRMIHSHFSPIIEDLFPPDVKKDSRFHAHLTIAFKDVGPKQFEGIWDHFKDQEYNRAFFCREITLLKYTDHKWIPFKSFSFGG